MPAPDPHAPLPTFRLLVLAGAIFASVSSEFLPTGLLPEIADGVGVSESRVGLLVSVFAGTVALTSIPLTLATQRFARKPLLVLTLSVFAVTNVIAALAPSYEVLLVSRVIGGLSHGLFWSVAGPYASFLVPGTQLARAIAITSGGGSLAFILGVPLTAALGHALGWRAAFGVMALIVVVFVVLAVVALPPVEHRRAPVPGAVATPLRRDPSLVGVGIVAVSTLVVATGHNAFYTYIAPWTIQVGGVPSDLLSGVLLALGVAGLVGAVLAGGLGDRWPRLVVTVAVSAATVLLVAFALAGSATGLVVTLLVLYSVAFGVVPPMMHTRNLHAASVRARSLAGSVVTTAFNIGIGLGALVGGLVLDGVGVAAIPLVAAGITAAGLLFVALTDRTRIARVPRELPADAQG
ncbi:MFS transporter [Cellulomonas marina]|uniref:Predicted arabinose efflux permease, MFS family n=1 Tax=Cellulomonas marina TaxID=988821 RepID=A0A1I0ZF68_9CELL|nr:MFS transporter [Cellulomonas marina]GIG28521.1 MFS transporter [Cellulomonas marina]SFB24304.1 Predicted arabinose efflux permease, MFS family [Cellulomonas marina]